MATILQFPSQFDPSEIRRRVETGPLTAVVVDGALNVVRTSRFQMLGDRKRMLGRIERWVKTKYVDPAAKKMVQCHFEVYLLPKGFQIKDVPLLRKIGVPLGFIYCCPHSGWTTFDPFIEDWGPLQHDFSEEIYLAESLDVRNARDWSTPEIVGTLDRLATEDLWMQYNSFWHRLYNRAKSARDARVADQHARQSQIDCDLKAYSLCLCAVLWDRGEIELATYAEICAASYALFDANAKVPEWLKSSFERYKKAMAMKRERLEALGEGFGSFWNKQHKWRPVDTAASG